MKPDDEARAVSITPKRSGDRISYVTLFGVALAYAYNVQPFQITGPNLQEVYDIEARTNGPQATASFGE